MRRHLLVVLDLLYHEHNTSTLIKEDHDPEYFQRSVEISVKLRMWRRLSLLGYGNYGQREAKDFRLSGSQKLRYSRLVL
jgi:hypothetical protein